MGELRKLVVLAGLGLAGGVGGDIDYRVITVTDQCVAVDAVGVKTVAVSIVIRYHLVSPFGLHPLGITALGVLDRAPEPFCFVPSWCSPATANNRAWIPARRPGNPNGTPDPESAAQMPHTRLAWCLDKQGTRKPYNK